MSKVRCPLCSNLNPPEADECSFCGARLKPLAQQPENQSGENRPEDENDWLRSLQSDQEEPGDTSAQQPAEPGEDVPDWLSRIRDRAQSETGGAEEQPDWMQDFSEDAAAGASGEEDWFARLEQPSPSESAEQPSAAEPAGDLPDWLSDLSGVPESLAEDAEPAEAEQFTASSGGLETPEEDFSWLGGAKQPETTGQSEQNTGFGLTGFLSSLESQPLPEGERPEDESASEEDAQETGLPEWLGAETSEAAETPETPETPAFEIPDWLAETPSSELPVSELPSDEEPEQAAPPDWMAGFAAEGQSAELQSELEAEPEGALEPADLPDWLIEDEAAASGQEVGETAAKAETEQSAAAVPAEVPDWMAEFQAPPLEQPEAPDIPSETPLFADEIPDFSAGEDSEPEVEALEAGTVEEVPSAPQENVPDWLRDFEEQTPSSAAVPPLFETEAQPEAAASEEGDQPFAVDLPDWLSEDLQREPGEDAPQTEEPAGEEVIAQAELPDWVKEMRPIESIIPAEAHLPEGEPRTEKSGPLAGLAGILPVEEMASQYRRPPVYSAKLRVTEKQRGQAAQFESIIEQESQPLLIPTRGKRAQGGWLRVLIAMLLIFVLALPPLLDMQPLAVPTLSPDETKRMFDQIEGGLNASAPVLLAVDFDPAFWGEMKLASQPVVDHIMSKNARIIVVSTRANGAALAQQLLSETVARHDGYNLSEMTENLGYLPGDMISLLEFAQEPVFAAPANLAGELAWERPALQGITDLNDFAGVVVLTDTAETGRAWVEQVQPGMGDMPLLMVTSAQAAPMMTPFIESGQVEGMVSGLLGGVLYAQWAQQESAGQSYLASYQVGVLLALAMALGGGLISGAIALINRGKDED